MKIEELIKKSPLYSPEKRIVLYRGNLKPKLIFVGEAPGKEENKMGKPFVGRSGSILDGWIEHFKLEKIFGISNAVPLIPLTEAKSIRKPTLDEINYFKPVLHKILDKKRPILLVCLGDSACTSILHRPISMCRNRIFSNPKFKVTAQYHPSYFLRRGSDGIKEFGETYKIIQEILGLPDINKDEKLVKEARNAIVEEKVNAET